jgi:uncharacterized protein YidB (DUF937 family)
MGIMDQIGEALGETANKEGGIEPALVQAVLQMLSHKGPGGFGGLAGLVEAFQSKGLESLISSWIGTGTNAPISPQQLQHGLGSDLLQQLAARAGVSPEIASAHLASLLPALIDRVTPNGKLPDGGLLDQGISQWAIHTDGR